MSQDSSVKFTVQPLLTSNNDSAVSVQRAALTHFKASTFTSYTELSPEDSMVLLVLGKMEKPTGKTIEGKKRKRKLLQKAIGRT